MADIDDVVRLVMRETWYWSAKHQVGEALQNQLVRNALALVLQLFSS